MYITFNSRHCHKQLHFSLNGDKEKRTIGKRFKRASTCQRSVLFTVNMNRSIADRIRNTKHQRNDSHFTSYVQGYKYYREKTKQNMILFNTSHHI